MCESRKFDIHQDNSAMTKTSDRMCLSQENSTHAKKNLLGGGSKLNMLERCALGKPNPSHDESTIVKAPGQMCPRRVS